MNSYSLNPSFLQKIHFNENKSMGNLFYFRRLKKNVFFAQKPLKKENSAVVLYNVQCTLGWIKFFNLVGSGGMC